jgi:hypothetical protein
MNVVQRIGQEIKAVRGENISLTASSVFSGGAVEINNTTKTLGFNTFLYTGTGLTQNIITGISSVDFTVSNNGSGFYHDRSAGDCIVKNDSGTVIESGSAVVNISKVHIKKRSAAANHNVFDGLRGVNDYIQTSSTNAEATSGTSLTAFTSTGVTLGTGFVNDNTATYVLYQTLYTHVRWGRTNQNKRYIEAYNPITKDTIIVYEGNGTVGHEITSALGKLDYVVTKNLDATQSWIVKTPFNDASDVLLLESTAAEQTAGNDNIELTDNGFNLLSGSQTNANGNTIIAYGKAKSDNWEIVKYTGSGVAGLKVNTSKRPARIIIKRLNAAESWQVQDNLRGATSLIFLNSAEVEATNSVYSTIITDNGFTLASTDSGRNASGSDYIALVEFDTDGDGGGNYFPKPSSTSKVNLTNADFIYTDGKNDRGYNLSSERITATIDSSSAGTGLRWVGKLKGGSYVFDNREPEFNIDGTVTRVNYDENGLDEFDVIGYTGNGATQTINTPSITGGVDFVWGKGRDSALHHALFDSVRGVGSGKCLSTNLTDAESSRGVVTALSSNSFTVDSSVHLNTNGESFVAWCASLPTDFSGTTNNNKAYSGKRNEFMSVATHRESGTNTYSEFNHGLGKRPELIIHKNRDTSSNWLVRAELYDRLGVLNSSNAMTTYTFNSTWSDSTKIKSLADSSTDNDIITYAFTSIEGKCKVSDYYGNGVAGGNTVSVGFEPAWVMIKRVDSASGWNIIDNVRGSKGILQANASSAESVQSNPYVSFNEDGFTLEVVDQATNTSGGHYIYMAIAKSATTKTVSSTPVSYLKNPVSFANNVPQYFDMSSTLSTNIVETLEAEKVIAKEFEGKNACTAWVNFSSTAIPVFPKDEFNVDDVSYSGSGNAFTIYFKEPMDNTNYSIVGGTALDSFIIVNSADKHLDRVVVKSIIHNGGASNRDDVNVQIFGGRD